MARTAGSYCSNTSPCSYDFFCNFDWTSSGTCEACSGCSTCSSCGLPSAGVSDCTSSCNVPAPPPAASPPPGPPAFQSSLWRVTAGGNHCQLDSNGCVTDGSNNYGNSESCTVTADQAITVSSTYFSTETYFDRIQIGTTRFTGSTGPSNVAIAPGQTMTWYTDSSVTNGGFVICAQGASSSGGGGVSESGAAALLTVSTGSAHCQVTSGGSCVTDGTSSYGNYEACTVTANQPVTVSATSFSTESYFDRIQIGTSRFSGSTGPSNVAMAAGSTMTWYADGSVTNQGFVICATPVGGTLGAGGASNGGSSPGSGSATGLLSVTSGSSYCSIDSSGCVTDGYGNHGSNEACTITANQAITVSSTYFNTESYYDRIQIGTTRFSGSTGPSNVAMAAGSTMTWYADGAVNYGGFVICPSAAGGSTGGFGRRARRLDRLAKLEHQDDLEPISDNHRRKLQHLPEAPQSIEGFDLQTCAASNGTYFDVDLQQDVSLCHEGSDTRCVDAPLSTLGPGLFMQTATCICAPGTYGQRSTLDPEGQLAPYDRTSGGCVSEVMLSNLVRVTDEVQVTLIKASTMTVAAFMDVTLDLQSNGTDWGEPGCAGGGCIHDLGGEIEDGVNVASYEWEILNFEDLPSWLCAAEL